MYRKLKKKNKAVQLIAHYQPTSPITEQYRLIKNNIHFSSVDQEIKSIVVTSPEPSDGKSTIAANLAIVLAQQGKPVLLVDADLRKPTVHYTFNDSNREGLTSVLTKKVYLYQATTKTQIPNLDILTSGPIPPNPSELLNSNSMEKIMGEMNDMYEYVVFDSPPVLVVTDPQILANKCDGVVLVVASGNTQKDYAMKAKDLLVKANAKLLGVVLNGVKLTKTKYYTQYS